MPEKFTMLGFLNDLMYQDEAIRLTWLDMHSEHMLEIDNGRRTGPWKYEWRQLTKEEVSAMRDSFKLSEMGIGPGDWMVRGICEAEIIVREGTKNGSGKTEGTTRPGREGGYQAEA